MNRLARTTVLLLSLSSLVGCTALEVPYEPPGHACGWDPVFGSCEMCGTCGGTCVGHTPVSYLGHSVRCTSGCGEIYWGPWHDSPPDQCDPCDDCGNFVGDRCCEPKLRQKIWWTLTGHTGPWSHGKGCATCGSEFVDEPYDEPYYEWDETTIAPNEAPTPELLPEPPQPAAPESETPAFLRPARGVSLSLPFQLRSVRHTAQ